MVSLISGTPSPVSVNSAPLEHTASNPAFSIRNATNALRRIWDNNRLASLAPILERGEESFVADIFPITFQHGASLFKDILAEESAIDQFDDRMIVYIIQKSINANNMDIMSTVDIFCPQCKFSRMNANLGQGSDD